MNIRLYKDDGISCFENKSGPDSEKIKKEVYKLFNDHN